MTYQLATISAAVDKLTGQRAEELRIGAHDVDALTTIMTEAMDQVARQMAHEGMCYAEATAMVAKGAMAIGHETDESNALGDRAFANRSTPLPAATTTAAAPSQPSPAMQVATIVEVEAPPAAAAPDTGDSAPVAAMPVAPVAAPFVSRSARAPEPAPLLDHQVVMTPVTEIFPAIAQDPRSHLFDFEVPFIQWDGGRLHPKIPRKKNYQFNLPDLFAALYAMATDTVTNIVGPTGCGKTELVKQIANRLNMPLTTVPMDGQITRNQLIGQRGIATTEHGPQDVWRDGILARALQEPGIILLDEVDRGVSEVQYAVHSIYTAEGLTLLDDGGRVLPMNRHNRVFTTSNTKGRGSDDGLYQTSEEMTEATRNRLTQWIEMDYQSKEDDAAILCHDFPGLDPDSAAKIASVASQIRVLFKNQSMSQPCSMRDQLQIAKRYCFVASIVQDEDARLAALADAVRYTVGNRANLADKAQIDTMIITTVGTEKSMFLDPATHAPAP